jgi:hypothetical protein
MGHLRSQYEDHASSTTCWGDLAPLIFSYRLEHSSDGWDPPQKELEWFHPNSRLIVLTEPATLVESKPAKRNTRQTNRLIAGFGIFRFDMEENENGEEDEVLYWYVYV